MDSAKYTKTIKFDKNNTVFVTKSQKYLKHLERKSDKYFDQKMKGKQDDKRYRLTKHYFGGIESQGWNPFNFTVNHEISVSERTEEIISSFKEQLLDVFNNVTSSGVESFSAIRSTLDAATERTLKTVEGFMGTLQHMFWIIPVTVVLVFLGRRPEWYEIGGLLFGVLATTFPDSLSEFKDYVLSLFSKKQDTNIEAQSGYFPIDIITNLIGMGTTMLLFGPKDYLIWWNNIKDGLFKVAHSLSEAEKVSEIVVKLMQGAINLIRSWFGKEKIVICSTGENTIDQWARKVAEVTKNYTLCEADMTPELVHALQALRVEGFELDNLYRLDKRYNNSIRYYLTELDKVCKSNAAAFAAAKGVRVEPVSLCLYGPPGIGKTILANALSQLVMAETLPISRIEELGGLLSAEIFQKGSSEYWEGYAGQFTYVIDDFAQQVDVEGAHDSDFMQLVRVVNSWQYPLNYASLENKGKNNFSSKFVMMTTNVPNLRLTAKKVVADPKAVLRRIHFPYRLGVMKEWCREGKDCLDENALDTAKYTQYYTEHGRIPIEAWFVQPWDYATGSAVATDRVLTIPELISRIVAELKVKGEQFTGSSKQIQANVLEVLKNRKDKENNTKASSLKLNKSIVFDENLSDDEFHDSLESLDIECQASDGFPGVPKDNYLDPWGTYHTSMAMAKEQVEKFVSNVKQSMWNPLEFCKRHPEITMILSNAASIAFGYFVAKFAIDTISKFFESKSDIKSEVIDYSVLENLNARVEIPTACQVKIAKNMYKILAINLTNKRMVKLGHVTGIVGKTFAVPLHFKKIITKDILSTAGPDDELIISLINVVNSDIKIEFPLKQFISLKSFDYDDMDVSFMEMPIVAACADITDKFLFRSELDISRNGIGSILYSTTGDTLSERYSTAFRYDNFTVDAVSDGYSVKRGFRYQIPTSKGDCGSILMVGSNVTHTQGRKILGFHTGGQTSIGTGFSSAVSQEMVKSALKHFGEITEKVELQEIEGQADDFVVKGTFMPLYKVKKPASSPPFTKLAKTCLYESWKKNERFPAHLRPFVSEQGELIKPMVVALNKYNTPIRVYDTEFVKSCAHVAYSKITEHTRHILDRSVVSFEQAVKGICDEDFARGLPRNTSSGYPYSVYGAKGKKDFFGDGEDYDLDNPYAKLLQKHCDEIEKEAKQGVRLLHVYNDFLKDERRSPAKNAKGETRLVSGAPLPYVIVFRKYFLRFMSAVMQTRVYNGCASGVNPYSDWKHMRDYLLENAKNCVAGDYSAFDASEQPQIHETILDYINGWYNDGEENARVRSVLWRDLVHSRHLGGDGTQNNIIYQWYHALPSGHPGTTIVNSMYNLCMFTMCWAKIMGQWRLKDYHDNVRIVVLGDDNLLTIKDAVVDKFNQHSITDAMSSFHMKYTSESKGDEVQPFRKITEVTFLKRGFYEEDGYVFGPLALETITEMPFWCKDKKKADDIVQTNFETALMELSAHPEEVWNQWAYKMYDCYTKLARRDTTLRLVRSDYQEVFKHQINIY